MTTKNERAHTLIIGMGRIGKAMKALLPTAEFADKMQEAPSRLGNYTWVISCLPFYATEPLAERCIKEKVPYYLDFTEDVGVRKRLYEKSKDPKNKTTFICGAGLAPGYVNMIAGRLVSKFKIVTKIRIYCGALPALSEEGYKLSWNSEGLVNQYLNKSEVVIEGKRQEVDSLTGMEEVWIRGEKYEAAYTSGGIGTIAERTTAKDCAYKTLRWPGHFNFISEIIKTFKINQDNRELLVNLIKNFESVTRDIVVVKVIVDGITARNTMKSLTHEEVIGSGLVGMTALQYATAMGALEAMNAVNDIVQAPWYPTTGPQKSKPSKELPKFIYQEDL